MTERGYRIWAAVTHEVLRLLCDRRLSLRGNPLVAAVLEHTRPDWVEWKTAVAMREVECQITELHQLWNQEQAKAQAPLITEAVADGSKAQQLLGGELRIKAPWSMD